MSKILEKNLVLLKDDETYNLIKILTSNKITPEELSVDVVSFMQEYEKRLKEKNKLAQKIKEIKKEVEQQKKKSEQIDQRYQKLIRPCLCKSVKQNNGQRI